MEIAAVIRRRAKLDVETALFFIATLVVYQTTTVLSMETLLTPPAGNSIKIKASTVNGVQEYLCSRGEWRLVGVSAVLVDSNNLTLSIGSYSYAFTPTDITAIGTWSLNNTDGVIVESGHALSIVTGRVISYSGHKFALRKFLALASSHRFDGTASLVSYIEQIPHHNCVFPNNALCKEGSPPFLVPYEADYWFWIQDRQPPFLPVPTLVASGRMIEGFFSTGYIAYHFNGTSWQPKSGNASMYDVPGGILVGRFYINSKADSAGGTFTWEVFDPNGWTITAKEGPSVQVDSTSLPWRLFNVTSGVNNTSYLSNITQVQMISTTGGLPPAHRQEATAGRVWRSSFTAISWFYTSS